MTSIEYDRKSSPQQVAVWDIVRGFCDWRLWAFLGLQDIRQRYRRSVLGPVWLTLGLGVTVIGIGLLYSKILHAASGNYIPFISISLLVWTFISTVLTKATTVFVGAGHVITAVRIPYTSFILRTITRNLIVAAHSTIVVVLAFLWFRYPVNWTALAAFPGLILVCANLYWMALLIGLVSARYRDVAQMVNYIIGIALFLTPVIWMPTTLRPGSPFLAYNPLAQMLQSIRAPIYDHIIPTYSYVYLLAMLVIGTGATLVTFIRSRRYLVYWM